MVQVEIAQLTEECSTWRDALRQLREEFTRDKSKLQESALLPLSKHQLQDVEHLQNQFHIQLINIHDLKQAIKTHCRMMDMEKATHKGQLREETMAMHEDLYDQYQRLDATLGELRQEFNSFLRNTP
ncbi:MAG: hypothetical protein J0H92_09770 [Sphingobacteriales bacterium]|nr:hypothetical protein [Sphingobacteriales bacterium]OJW30211.1 MAG: hypothetical protein BGO54_01035 [Sphingobacteriales bacterium 46-32]